MFSTALAAAPWPLQLTVIIALTIFGAWLVWYLIKKQAHSVGHNFRDHYWPEIKKSPIAVALYRVGVYVTFVWLVKDLLGRFA